MTPHTDKMASSRRPWSDVDALGAVQQAFTSLGRRESTSLIRLGENAIFALGDGVTVARVARPTTLLSDIERTLTVALDLVVAGVPTGRPNTAWSADPIVTEQGTVVFWDFYKSVSNEVDFSQFGRLLARLHGHTPAMPLPNWDPYTPIHRRLDQLAKSGTVPAHWIIGLRKRAYELQRVAEASPSGAPQAKTIHGDAHSGNLIVSANGLILVDLDSVSVGPIIADLVPTYVQEKRFKSDSRRLDALLEGYGTLSRQTVEYSPFVAVREMTMVSWLLQQYGLGDKGNAEIEMRVDCILDPSDSNAKQRWSPF